VTLLNNTCTIIWLDLAWLLKSFQTEISHDRYRRFNAMF